MLNKHTTLLAAPVLLSTLIASLMSTTVMADDHKFEAIAGVGRTFFDDSIDDATHLNLGLGYIIDKNWTLEAIASRYDSETEDTNIDVNNTQYRLDALYNIDTSSQWHPYVAFGAGRQKREFESVRSQNDTLLNVGAGVKHSLGDDWEFRTDVRAFRSITNEHDTDVAVNASIVYLFGGAPAKAAPVVAVAPVAVVVKDLDTDGDGVFDSKDKCPDTPMQYKVDAVGCPMELTESVAIKLAVKFDSAKSVVKDMYLEDIGNLAKFMNQYANTIVTVEGHTDSQGADAYNQSLSQSRAEAVKAVLISKFNIAAERVTAMGYGEAKPVADNKTATGREENRRVVGAVSTDVTKKQVR
jgi:OmpA-OmpF porin, OOP family